MILLPTLLAKVIVSLPLVALSHTITAAAKACATAKSNKLGRNKLLDLEIDKRIFLCRLIFFKGFEESLIGKSISS
ncbi:MAG: hypothetical protein ACI9OI_001835 [Chitinophagales bacterium]|jgi:hypothetical protein